jgi:6-phosphofructokinase 1
MTKTIGILTGGGDVPGLNTVIRDFTLRARKLGFNVIGIRRGWGGLIYMDPNKKEMNPEHAIRMDDATVRRVDREGGTFLHSSRVKPTSVTKNPDLMEFRGLSFDQPTDMTEDVIKNLQNLEIDTLVAVGGDDTLSYAVHLHNKGFKVLGIPKTMDGDIYGTDYCLGFSTAISKAADYITQLRTTLGSHERIGVIEIAGRNSGFTALNAALAAKPDRVLIPEVDFDMDTLLQLLLDDKKKNPSGYSFCLTAEGAKPKGGEQVYSSAQVDDYGHRKLGGVGKLISSYISYKTNRTVMSEELGYYLRAGNPDAKDRIVASVYANITANAIAKGDHGLMASMKDGRYQMTPLVEVLKSPKKVDVARFYNSDRYHPIFENFESTEILL